MVSPSQERTSRERWLKLLSIGIALFCGLVGGCADRVQTDSFETRLAGEILGWGSVRTSWNANPSLAPQASGLGELTPVERAQLEFELLENPEGLGRDHTSGLLHLSKGDTHAAIRAFTSRSSTDQTAAFWNDLAAAHLLHHALTNEPNHQVLALDAAARSYQSEPELASFNLARSLFANGLLHQAGEFLDEWRERSPNDPWLVEAQAEWERLPKPSWPDQMGLELDSLDDAALNGIVARHMESARVWSIGELRGAWLAARQAADIEAEASSLAAMQRMARALLHAGDPTFSLFVSALESLSAPEQSALAEAFSPGSSPPAAGLALRRAASDRSAPLPTELQIWIELFALRELLLEGAYVDPSLPTRIASQLDGTGFLYARAVGLAAYIATREGRFDQAAEGYREGIRALDQIPDIETGLSFRSRLASMFNSVEAFQQDDTLRGEILARSAHVAHPIQRYMLFVVAGSAAEQEELLFAALYFHREQVHLGEQTGFARSRAYAEYLRGRVSAKIGDTDDLVVAIRNLRQAEELITAPNEQRRAKANRLELEGHLASAEGQSEEAVRLGRSAIELYAFDDSGDFLRELDIYGKLSRWYLDLWESSNSAEHGADVDALIDHSFATLDKRRPSSELLRRTSQRTEWRLIDRARPLANLAIRRALEDHDDPQQALEYCERWRAPDLSIALGADGDSAIQPVLRRLEPDQAMIVFFVGEFKSYAWRLYRNTLRSYPIAMPGAELDEHVDDWLSALGRGDKAEFRQHAAPLYDTWLKPVIQDIPRDTTLSIIADGSLHRAPLAALWDPANQEYLIERYSLAHVPSLASWLQLAPRGSESPLGQRPLIVGDPSFDAAEFPAFHRLPYAQREASKISEGWPNSRLIQTEQATRDEFLKEFATSDVIHFAGHGQSSMVSPSDSFLLFADGKLLAETISQLSADHVRLVVMSSCDTARGPVSTSEGALTLARSFLWAGVRSVVGSLWSVRDDSTELLATDLHGKLRDGEPAHRALRQAQLQAIHSESRSDPRFWAGFQLYGAPR